MKLLRESIKYVGAIVLVATVLVSCKKDEDNNDNGGGNNNSGAEHLTADIDGTGFSANGLTIGATVSNGVFAVQGNTDAGNTIRVTIGGDYTGEGTYDLGGLTNPNTGVYIIDPLTDPLGWSSFAAGTNSGTIEVTSDNGMVVEGTFEFEAVGGTPQSTVLVTSGSFKADIEE